MQITPCSWQPIGPEADELGESPFWHPDEQCLYWVDVPGKRVHRACPGQPRESWTMPSEPGCIAPARSGGLVIGLRDGVYRARAWGGVLTCIAPFSHDPATMRLNDGKADPLGRFWAGTIYEPKDARRAELYSVDCRPHNGAAGTAVVTLKAGNATTANGLAFSPDRKTLYWADTPQHVVWAWDWDAEANALHGHRVFHQFPPKPAGWKLGQDGYGGRPDGAPVDVEGNYWCAMYEGGRVLKLSPAGEILAELSVPARCPTMPCFGGDDLHTLFVTTARQGRPAQELAALPQSGCVFSTRMEVAGLPVNFFID